MFSRSKTLRRLTQLEVLTIATDACPVASVEAGRPEYLAVDIQDMREFLAVTEIDRYKWREAQPATDTPELVCTSFSCLLWGLLEQERLRAGCLWPLAGARSRLYSHSIVSFITPNGAFMLIEPQTDAIVAPAEYVTTPERTVQSVMFL